MNDSSQKTPQTPKASDRALTVRLAVCLAVCLFLFVSSAVFTVLGVLRGAGGGQVGEDMVGIGYFKAFTIDSNILAGLAAGVTAFFLIRRLFRAKKESEVPFSLPRFVLLLDFAAVCGVMLTFFTVIFFLAPMEVVHGRNFLWLYAGSDIFCFHLVNPLLSLFLLLLLPSRPVTPRETLVGLLPTVLYSAVYTPMILTGTWSDFYGFTFGGKFYLAPAALLVMYLATYLIAFLIRLADRACDKRFGVNRA